MTCAWNELLEIIPRRIRQDVDLLGKYELQELRMRINAPAELVLKCGSRWLNMICSKEDIVFCIQAASKYSPWAAQTISQGFLTAPGGHRIGLCGIALYRNGHLSGLKEITSVCIRVARDYPGISSKIEDKGSVLILGAPGWGKTTLLRDLIRQRSLNRAVSVIDERGELFPNGFETGKRTDVLRGCHKICGIQQVLRTMSPQCIAVDEITEEEDCAGLIQVSGCGVEILATAHAGSIQEFLTRPMYKTLAERGIFHVMVVLHANKTYTVERMSSK